MSAPVAGHHLVGFHCRYEWWKPHTAPPCSRVPATDSAAKGLWNAVLNAKCCGATSFAFFTRSSRSWTAPALPPADAVKFKQLCIEHGFDAGAIMPHGTYLSNSATSAPEIRKKSLDGIVDEAEVRKLLPCQIHILANSALQLAACSVAMRLGSICTTFIPEAAPRVAICVKRLRMLQLRSTRFTHESQQSSWLSKPWPGRVVR